MVSVSIIGAGRIGGALAIALSKANFRVENLTFRKAPRTNFPIDKLPATVALGPTSELGPIRSDVVIIATPDPQISTALDAILDKLSPPTVVLHTSGVLSSDVLAEARNVGIAVGSMHPLVAVSDPLSGSAAFTGSYFCVEGDADAIAAADRIAHALAAHSFAIATDLKPLYHAGAVMAAGHVVSLLDAALAALSSAGIDKVAAKKMLTPLVTSSVDNFSRQDAASALTGPFARADLATVELHLAAFDRADLEQEKAIYLELGSRAVDLAAENGADAGKLAEIRTLISMAKRSAKC